ncbi:MAG: LamG-like jellyroll fold domain-containing protein, partial [Bacteroidota bacterium]
WSVEGGTIVEGQDTNEMTVIWNGAKSGIVNVTETDPNNTCSFSASLAVNLSEIITPTIQGNTTACLNETYSIDPQADVSYQWEIQGGEIKSGQGSSEISAVWESGGNGNLKIIATEEVTGCQAITEIAVSVSDDTASCLDRDLLIYYPFNGDALDHSGNEFHGTANATLTEDRNGNPNSAYFFDGLDDYVDLPFDPALKPELPVTLAFWMKMESIRFSILTTDFGMNVHSGVWFALAAADNRIAVSTGDGFNTTAANRKTKIGNTIIETGQWYYIMAVVKSIDEMDLYVNYEADGGTFAGTSDNLAYTDQPGSLGRKDGDNVNPPIYFHGVIDEFRYWDRALGQEEIEELFTIQKEETPVTTALSDQLKNSYNVLLYPNPALDKLRIQIENGAKDVEYSYEIIHLSGHKMDEGKIKPRKAIKLNGYASGLYVLRIYDAEKVIASKLFIKE